MQPCAHSSMTHSSLTHHGLQSRVPAHLEGGLQYLLRSAAQVQCAGALMAGWPLAKTGPHTWLHHKLTAAASCHTCVEQQQT